MKETIIMSKKELNRVPILEKALKKLITNSAGAKIIGVSTRQFRRIKRRYKTRGVEGITHQSRGKKSNNIISENLKSYAMKIIQEKYYDFGPTLAGEKLMENHSITMSVETLRKEMIKSGVWKSKSKHKINLHQMRERRAQAGELVQIDGSPHDWFEGRAPECDLLVFIDDATGKLLWLEFAVSESTESYFKAVEGYLLIHGRPLSFYSDKHSVFRVNTSKVDSASTDDSNGDTQFGRAMRELDIEMIFANSPQAKGRVERVNKTLQDRLIKEMRLLNICSIEEANKYLPKFIKQFNNKFAVAPKSQIDAHRPLLNTHNLSEILCLKSNRVISKNLMVQYKNMTYKIQLETGYEYTLKRAKVEIIERLDGSVLIKYKNKQLNYSTINTNPESKVYDSKMVNKRVEEIKKKQGHILQFNLLGRTFLLWRKADISILD